MCKSVKSVLAALCGVTALAALPAEVLAGPMSAASPTSVGLTTSFEQAYYWGYRRGYYRRGYGIPGAAVAPRLARGRRGRRFGRGNRGRIGLRLSRLRLWRRVWRQFVLAVGPRRWLGVGLLIKRAPSCAAIGREAATATGLAVNRVGATSVG